MSSTEETTKAPGDAQSGEALESGTYEILKGRLAKHSDELKRRLALLNAARKEVFGSIENTLLGSERILTDHNCIPRDMIAVGDRFIFGYNVHMGLKTSVDLGDVFSIYEFRERKFNLLSLDILGDAKFTEDFQDLYKYYKNTSFAKFTVIGPFLYMIFRVGRHVSDIKTFKWLMEDDAITYVDNRSDHEVVYPSQQDFIWTRATRDDHRAGVHPHISIMDRVFVETVGGDLTIKVEDNTETGRGIYAEPVDNKDQTLDDAETYYTAIGNIIILKIRPFQEKDFRYFVFNEKMQRVLRLDSLEQSGILLPDNQGLIFPNGYYLQSGEYKTFDLDLGQMIFAHRLSSTNGEDHLYTFHNLETGVYLLLSYNIIAHGVETPVVCSGYSHFETGEMVLFKAEEEPKKNHVIQIWQTPYVGKDYVATKESDSLLFKIGNKEIVRCMAECQAIINLIAKDESYSSLYVDIAKSALYILDTYFWLDKKEGGEIRSVIQEIRETATLTVAEFEKVVRIRRATADQIGQVSERTEKLIKKIVYSTFSEMSEYVDALSELRVLRGEIISLKELRYTDLTSIDAMEKQVREQSEVLSGKCVEFLLDPKGLDPYKARVAEHTRAIDGVDRSSVGKEVAQKLAGVSRDLDLLIEIVSNLKIDDPTKSTEIIDTISTIYSTVNQAKSRLTNRLKELQSSEGTAEFNSQLKLLNQSSVNYLDVADSPEKCEEYLTKLMVHVEELEGKFADFDDFLPKLTQKREELFEAFESRKLALMEKRNKRAASLFGAAERILKGVKNALGRFESVSEINGYIASNIMVEKVRDVAEQLVALGDSVKADEVESQLKSIREEAVRQLKDRQELFVDGADVIRFGNHSFSVNTHQLDLSVVQKEGGLYFHLTGTDFWQPFDDPEINDLHDVWELESPAESPVVYKAEYLAWMLLRELPPGIAGKELLEAVRAAMTARYQEGYTKGVHDEDATKILAKLLDMRASIDLLTYPPAARALATLYWHLTEDVQGRELLGSRLKHLNHIVRVYEGSGAVDAFTGMVRESLTRFATQFPLFDSAYIDAAAAYLTREIMRGDAFIISSEAEEIYKAFNDSLREKRADRTFRETLESLKGDMAGALILVREWITAWNLSAGAAVEEAFLEETAVLLLLGNYEESR
ncbi:DNA repair ATPase, partial [Myxococcota bacterium]|nr:DNA repair ATPase [Myxococcota bacterium]